MNLRGRTLGITDEANPGFGEAGVVPCVRRGHHPCRPRPSRIAHGTATSASRKVER